MMMGKKLVLVVGLILAVAVVSLSLLLGGGITTGTVTTQTVIQTVTQKQVAGTINGAGASFLNPQMQAWASKFYELTKGRVKVNYQSIGSGAGQANFKEGLIDFAGSDPPLKKEIYDEFQGKSGIIQFPVIIGTIVVVYNIPNIETQKLRLTGEVIAKIYLGEIVYWDDPLIKELNPDLNLPHEKIIAVHRSDGSGTTRVFTAYLSKIYKPWKEKVGSDFTVQWPVDQLGNGVGAKGNEGVAAAVQQNLYSIGYVETAYAYGSGLKIALIRNRNGQYVIPTEETVKSSLIELTKILPKAHEDWSKIFPDETVDPPGLKSYPIVSFSFIILRQDYDDEIKVALLREFFTWVLTEGQKKENIVPGYYPLPPEVAQIGLEGLKLLR
ncbi:MAG: phosphate ABC transporter substrate-binding protein PstS [Aigarchaeota archaeon]|nr:phosphate ABC transporter substrate-binding protein PstS [Candidatus Geocrenenecus dongiae]